MNTINNKIKLIIISLLISTPVIQIVSSSTNIPSQTSYNVYNYDHTTPIFTPDGLLKQVEYASLASGHSSPMVIVPVIVNDNSDGSNGDDVPKCYIIMASAAAISKGSSESAKNDNVSENITKHEMIRGQSNIIPIPISPPHYPISSYILVGINGLLPDCMFLLRHARNELHSYHKKYGIHRIHTSRDGTKGEETTPLEYEKSFGTPSSWTLSSSSMFASASSCSYRFAKSIAEKCQRNSFGGGLRPFGSQIVTCGVDKTMMNIHITDPSGAIYHHGYSIHDTIYTNGNDARKASNSAKEESCIQDVIVLGGQNRIRKQIKQGIMDQRHGLGRGCKVKEIVKVIYDCLQKNVDDDPTVTTSNTLQNEKLLQSRSVNIVLLGEDNCQSISSEQLRYILQE